MPIAVTDTCAHVVRGPAGRVVVMFWGSEADTEAAEWMAEGYRIDTIDRRQLEDGPNDEPAG
jgi:hypothetical protein